MHQKKPVVYRGSNRSKYRNTGTLVLSGTDCVVNNSGGNTYFTGTHVRINSGTMYLTGSIDNNTYNITGSQIHAPSMTGTTLNFNTTGVPNTIYLTGQYLTFNSDVHIHTGILDDISTVSRDVNYRENAQGTWVNPTVRGDVNNFSVLQINGDVSFRQTSGDTMVSGEFQYLPTGHTPTGTLDPSTGSGLGMITYDTGWLYINVQHSGWLRSRLYPWGAEHNQYGEDGTH